MLTRKNKSALFLVLAVLLLSGCAGAWADFFRDVATGSAKEVEKAERRDIPEREQ